MSDNDNLSASSESELNENDCYAERKTIGRVHEQAGEIYLVDNVNFGIRQGTNNRPLIPCNLPAPLQKAGTKIVFSGAIKEPVPCRIMGRRTFCAYQSNGSLKKGSYKNCPFLPLCIIKTLITLIVPFHYFVFRLFRVQARLQPSGRSLLLLRV
ncbi:MAG: hypothetical protein JWP81_2853 [Ferruginibacter sp.]|nr:hypothetical protein [Ferruginibacter sp.]